jgi:ADP-heptose:LPS heptosyltransferase
MSAEAQAGLAGRFLTLADLTLGQLAGLIGSADAYLGNDSGPTHLAAAIGVATVALFGPTDPDVWGPRGERVTILRGRPAAGPGWGIDPADVAAAAASHSD